MKKAVFLAYFLFLLCLVIFSYFFIDPNLPYLRKFYTGLAFERKVLTGVLYSVFISLSFLFYFFFWRLLSRKKISLLTLKKIIGVTVIILFFSYPAMLSYDIFNYLTTAKVLFFYRENPYLVMPIEFVGEPFLSFTRAANKLALYGPGWLGLSSFPYFLGLGSFWGFILGFKILIYSFYLGTIFLIFKLTKSWLSVLLFALNPLVIVETLVSLHNDIAMMFLALLAFWLVSKTRNWLAITSLMLSILIKYATLFLAPVFLFIIWQKKEINWARVFYFSALAMFIIFFLSPFREEIYPWYAIWFLVFTVLVPQRKILLYLSVVFSFSLMLRYLPYLFLGTYLGPAPILRTLLTFLPPLSFLIIWFVRQKLWLKKISRF